MKYANYCWIDTAFGGVNKRNNLVDVRKVVIPALPDCYRTVYRYPDMMQEHFTKGHTVAGYDGYVYADWLPLDIDDDDLQKAHSIAIGVLNKLLHGYDVNLAALRCFFSGAKGFHILIPAEILDLKPSKHMPAAFKKLVPQLLDDVKVDTSIYDTVRLFRLANTVNSKTGLYKIPVSTSEILHQPLESILELAKAPRTIDIMAIAEMEPNEILVELYKKAEQAVEKKPERIMGNLNIRGNAKIKPCIERLLKGIKEGGRDNAGLRVAVHFAKQGIPEDMLLAAMEAWNCRNIPPLESKRVEVLVKQATQGVYDHGCNDPILHEACSMPCVFGGEEEKTSIDKVKDVVQAYEGYLEYIKNLRKVRVKLGFGALDEKMRGIAPGEVCQIIARPAVGKTTLVLNILRNASMAGAGPIVFFTMEMPLAQVFERMCQISAQVVGYSVENAAKKYLDNGDGEVAEYASKVFTAYNKVYFVEDDGLNLQEMENFCKLAEQRIGEKPAMIAIDYMGRMRGSQGSAYEVTSSLAKGLKYLAKKLSVAVLSLHQTSRAGGDGTEPVTLESARDSGTVEEAADFLIGMWRPDKKEAVRNGREEEDVILALLKNRRGAEVKTRVIFTKPTLTMYGSTECQE